MEDLLGTIEKSCFITSDNESFNKRKTQFKFSGRTEDSAREKRRTQLLEDYKKKREALLDEKRGLLNDEFNDNEDWMDWKEASKSKSRKWINYNCKNQLMLSEWLLDRPHDLHTDWTVVLCPEGRRTLVVAKKGCTRAYHKSGFLLAKFKSILPGGSPADRSRNSDVIILDCIWKESTKQLFALDVLHWKNQTLLNCDAQFRLYWLKSKLTELKQTQSPKAAEEGVYDVFLPHHCSLSTLIAALSEHDPSQVDGVLFYHNNAPYVSGHTPLVGWLKPYMLAERFDLAVPPQYLALRPDTYTDLEQWVTDVSHSHLRRPKQNKHQEKMDSSDIHCSDATSCLDLSVGEIEDTAELNANKNVMDS